MKLLYDGFVKIYECKNEKNETYNKVVLKGAVGCLVINENHEIVLVKQYRPILGKHTLEIPAGTLDKNISIKDTLIEELEEECGIKREDIISMTEEPILTYDIIENMSDGQIHLFLVNIKNKELIPNEEDDVEEVKFYKKEEIEDLIKQKKITDPKTLLAFFMYKEYYNG